MDWAKLTSAITAIETALNSKEDLKTTVHTLVADLGFSEQSQATVDKLVGFFEAARTNAPRLIEAVKAVANIIEGKVAETPAGETAPATVPSAE